MPENQSSNEMTGRGPAADGKVPAWGSASRSDKWVYPLLVLAALLVGVLASFFIWGNTPAKRLAQAPVARGDWTVAIEDAALSALVQQVNPPEGYGLTVTFGELGPRMIAAGVIDYEAFAAIYEGSENPLSEEEVTALRQGSDSQVTITAQNAHFLLNFLWAVGLANRNSILTEGPMVTNSGGQVDQFASTGGWGLALKPINEIYASMELILLTPDQQQRVEEVAAAVYRPCCNNPTLFPDCNHGMAMLGLLELMASQGASTDEMFTAAKHVNAFWFPQQMLETAIYMKAMRHTDFVDADARLVVGKEFSSGSGSGAVHRSLQAAGLLGQELGRGNSCAN